MAMKGNKNPNSEGRLRIKSMMRIANKKESWLISAWQGQILGINYSN